MEHIDSLTQIKVTRPDGTIVYTVQMPTRTIQRMPDVPDVMTLTPDGRLFPAGMVPGEGGILPPWTLHWSIEE